MNEQHNQAPVILSENNVINEPAVFIPGVRKCGTTTLFSVLQKHSQVAASKHKEPQFFALSESTIKCNFDWYRGLFDAVSGSTLLDGSTLCLLMPGSARLIDKYFSDVKVIVMIRDPAKRVFSAYLHMLRQINRGGETRSFEEVLEAIESQPEGVSLIDRERKVIDDCVRDGSINGRFYDTRFHREMFDAPFDTDFSDNLIGYRYFEESCYSQYIREYEEVFGDRLRVVVFEEMLADPEGSIRDVLDFTGLAIEEDVLTIPHENKGRIPKSKLSSKIIRVLDNNSALRSLANSIKHTPLIGPARRLRDSLWKKNIAFEDAHRKRVQKLLSDEYRYWFDRIPGLDRYWSSAS